jgi:hypothetical protein
MKHNWETVFTMLSDESRLIDWDSERERIKRLCAKFAVESANSESLKTKDAELKIRNGYAELPDDCYKFLYLYNSHGEIEAVQESEFVKPKNIITGDVTVRYKAISLDDDEMPIISDAQLNYVKCAVNCAILKDEYMMGKLPKYIWDEMTNERDGAYRDSIKPKLTKQRMDHVVYLLKNARYFQSNPSRG